MTSRRPRRALGAVGLALVLLGTGSVVIGSAIDATTSPTSVLATLPLVGQRVAPLTAHVVGGDLPINAGAIDLLDIRAHNSPTLAVDPRNGADLVVTNRVDLPRFSCGLHWSNDGGATWSDSAIPIPAGEEPKCYAPDAAFDAAGRLFVSFVTLHGLGNSPNAVWLTASDDGGRTLAAPQRVTGELAFQVRLAADPAVPGHLYVTWLQAEEVGNLLFPTVGNPIVFARTADGGASWEGPTRVTPASRSEVLAATPATGAHGELYVLYLDLGRDPIDYRGSDRGLGGEPWQGQWQLVLARSLDRGATWSDAVVDPGIVPTERFIPFLPPFPSLAVDRPAGRIYAAFQDGRAGDADVYVWSSSDGGQSFGGAVRVNDTPVRDGTSQYRPALAVAPSGRLDVAYYDRRADPANVLNEVSFQSSSDGGHTFSPRVRLSGRPFSSRIGYGADRGLPDLGSRLALASTDARAIAVWTDTRAGTEASNKQDLARAVVEFTVTPRGGTAFKVGGFGAGAVGLALVASWTAVRWRRPERVGTSSPAAAATDLTDLDE